MLTIKNIYNGFIDNEKFKHIIRFGCVGCLNTMFDFGVFSLLNSLFGINYVISQIVSYSSGTLNSYLCNRFWTFNDTRTNKKTTNELFQFVAVNAASLGVSLIGLSILMKDNSMNSFLAKIISMVLAQIVNFLGYRFWVFGKIKNSNHINNKDIA
ncbi:Putative flippase GtrA (transmembrane translocase of bactoprenol-linked glucose) [Clostridium acidisoli DSM 12555]|jgi:putative flippase GtrA|uniref:Putative flippase GtrA (Transmembrane translocase of bactoprenol-linked glucose) n=1 Tax=Clostridium acidisoli DSM 12555 TaxID=1121291 RepID=A0A1W1XBI5_9CLOT|nr:GtrA family protein [Clostridium acidisoli]SMC21144.1 Putative flippase GtrA (transmembrane translocase of bactoprenol-linked glucose) [Clostridium acidisoli DSM 12555]